MRSFVGGRTRMGADPVGRARGSCSSRIAASSGDGKSSYSHTAPASMPSKNNLAISASVSAASSIADLVVYDSVSEVVRHE